MNQLTKVEQQLSSCITQNIYQSNYLIEQNLHKINQDIQNDHILFTGYLESNKIEQKNDKMNKQQQRVLNEKIKALQYLIRLDIDLLHKLNHQHFTIQESKINQKLSLERQLQKIKTHSIQKINQLIKLEQKINSLSQQSKRQTFQIKLAPLKLKVKQVKQSFKRKQNQHQTYVQQLLTSIDNLNQRIFNGTQENDIINHQKANLVKHLNLLRLKKNNQQQINKDLRQSIQLSGNNLQNKSQKIALAIFKQQRNTQILQNQINSLNYQIEQKHLCLQTSKKYLQKTIRSQKRYQKKSFQQIQQKIQTLKQTYQQMNNKKIKFNQDIKKYKHKRVQFIDQYRILKQKQQQMQQNNQVLKQIIQNQKQQFNQLQNQYFDIQKFNSSYQKELKQQILIKQQIKRKQQMHLSTLRQKKRQLNKQLEELATLSQRLQCQIDNNKNLVPIKIIKELQNKINKIKQKSEKVEINQELYKLNQILLSQIQQFQQSRTTTIQTISIQYQGLIKQLAKQQQKIRQLRKTKENIDYEITQYRIIQNNQKQILQQRQQGKQAQFNIKDKLKSLNLHRQNLINKFRQTPLQMDLYESQQDQKQLIKQNSVISENLNSKVKIKHNNSQNKCSQPMNLVNKQSIGLNNLKMRFPCNLQDQSQTKIVQHINFINNPILYVVVIYFLLVIPAFYIIFQ